MSNAPSPPIPIPQTTNPHPIRHHVVTVTRVQPQPPQTIWNATDESFANVLLERAAAYCRTRKEPPRGEP